MTGFISANRRTGVQLPPALPKVLPLFTVYVLHSKAHQKIYVGYTATLQARLDSHNLLATKGYTFRFRPWTLIYTEEFLTKTEALKRERQLKSAKGRQFIWNLIQQVNWEHHTQPLQILF